jgi:hypothetical protein
MGQLMREGPATHGGGIDAAAEATMRFRSGATIRRRRFGREEFTQERFDARGPVGRMIAPGSAGRPGLLTVVGGSPEIVGV